MKFFASKQIQRVANFSLALMLVVSTISASVPFLFSEKADAVAGAVYSNVGLGGWVTDRAPASGGVSQTTFDGRNVLALGVVTPTTAETSFSQYEGVKKTVAATKTVKADLYVDPSWPANVRAGLWGEGFDASNAISSYPIIEFNKSVASNWRIFDSTSNGGWREVAVPTATTGWNTIELAINKTDSAKTDVYVNGVLVGSSLGYATESIKTIFLNNYNYGIGNYTVRWSNIQTGQYTPDAPTALKFYKGTTEVPAGTSLNVANGSKTVELKWQSTGAINQYSTRVTYPDGSSEEHWTGTKGLWIGQTAYVSNKFGLKGDGVYKYETKARSATTGLWSDWSVASTLRFDSTAPVLGQVTYGAKVVTDGVVLAGTNTFTVNLAELNPGKTYVEVDVLNNGTWAKVVGNESLGANANAATLAVTSNLAQYGKQYQLKISTTDALGNHISYTIPFTVDNVRPSVSIAAPAHQQFTNNVKTIDFLAHDDANLASVTYGIVNQGSPVTVPATGKDQTFNVSVGTFNLADGSYTFRMTATDTAGNVSFTADRAFKVDNTKPGVPTLVAPTPVGGAVLGVSNFLIDWSDVTDAGSGVSHYEYQAALDSSVVNGVLSNPIVKSIDNQGPLTASQIQSNGTPDGTYYWQVRAIDKVGNAGDWSAVGTIIVDTVPTEPPVVSATGIANNSATNQPQAEFMWSTPAGAVKYDYRVWTNIAGSEYISPETAYPANGLTGNSRTGAFAVGEGSYFVQVRAYDLAGNVSAWSETFTVVYDETNPDVTIDTVSPNASTISGTVSEIATVTVTVDSQSYSATVEADGTWSVNTPALEDGVYQVSVVATDSATNTTNPAKTANLKIDTTAPAVVITTASGLVADTTPTINGTYTSDDYNDTVVTISVDGAPAVPVADNGDGTWSYTPATALAQGVHTFVATATDGAQNSADSTELELTIDTFAPALTIVTVSDATGNTPTITGTAETNAILSVTFNGVTSAIANNAGAWSFTSPTALANGTYAFTITATDEAGNVTTGDTNVIVAVAAPAAAQTFTVTPATISPAANQGVLGETTDNEAAQNGAADVAGTSDDKSASEQNKGTIFGLAWYWWILILAALAALAWFIIGAVRRRNEA